MRKPSAEILQQLAKGLRISAEQLYVQAGLLEDRGTSQALEAAIVSDVEINERQKRVLLDIYASFVTENHSADDGDAATHGVAHASAPVATKRPSDVATATSGEESTRSAAKKTSSTRKAASSATKATKAPPKPPKPLRPRRRPGAVDQDAAGPPRPALASPARKTDDPVRRRPPGRRAEPTHKESHGQPALTEVARRAT